MTEHDTYQAVWEREFPGLRARILEIAAILDRLDRSNPGAAVDPRREQVRQALAVLDDGHLGDRAESVQLVFSRPYDSNWWSALDMDQARTGRT